MTGAPWPGPQQHDLTGVDRPDYSADALLALPVAGKRALIMTAYNSWALAGYPSAPLHKALTARMSGPRPGDLCYVPDAVYGDDERVIHGFGYLLVARYEPVYDEPTWQKIAADYETRPVEQAFYLQYGPAVTDVCRWENAACHAMPHTGRFADEVRAQCAREGRRMNPAQPGRVGHAGQ